MTNSRLATCFAQLKREGRAGLVAYVMASDPDTETSFEILRGLPGAGADVIELGFPFTDPMADGPSIQRAAQRALRANGSLSATLELVARFRKHDTQTPLVLMGYLNPIEQMTAAAFAQRAGEAGVDGAIIVDAPPEEDHDLRQHFAAHDLALIRLATPTTGDKRLPKVLEGASGFLYYVAVAGVTGAKAASADAARAAIQRLKRATDLPVALGFGVREPELARDIARSADAVVVGSAFVDEITAALADGKPGDAHEDALRRVLAKVKTLAHAVRTAREREGAPA